jgi:hypothetical protein
MLVCASGSWLIPHMRRHDLRLLACVMHGDYIHAHATATWALVGLIWFVQLVHYPLLSEIAPGDLPRYELRHRERIFGLVATLMAVEAVTAGLLVTRTTGRTRRLGMAGLALLGVIWISTWAWQVPLHERLSHVGDRAAIAELVASNWLRTIAWTLRGGLAWGLLRSAMNRE